MYRCAHSHTAAVVFLCFSFFFFLSITHLWFTHMYAHLTSYISFHDANQNTAIWLWAEVSRLGRATINAPIDQPPSRHSPFSSRTLAPPPSASKYISIFWFPIPFVFTSDNSSHLSRRHWQHCKSKLCQDRGKESASALIYEISLSIDTRAKSDVKGGPGDICQRHAVDTVFTWERESEWRRSGP